MKVAICGAGIAGGTLAYWLLRAGHEPFLIERAPAPRTSGYVMDFWGVGYAVAERMGILPAVREVGYQVDEVRFLDDAGNKVGGFTVDALREATGGRLTSVSRYELAAAINRSLEGNVETLFDDTIMAIEERTADVRITLKSGETRNVDIVIGADGGLHSRVRELAFGPENRYEKDLGYRVAVFEAEGYRPRDEDTYVIHSATSRQVARFAVRGGRTLFLLVFQDALMEGAEPSNDEKTRALLQSIYVDVGWEMPAILRAMERVEDIYFDRVSQIRMASWHKGRVALVGDAGMAVSLLAGEGAGLAMTEAYVLAGELARAGGDYRQAFQSYERQLRPFIEAKQRAAVGFASTFVPKTHIGIWARNLATKLLSFPGMANLLLGPSLRDDFELPDYQW